MPPKMVPRKPTGAIPGLATPSKAPSSSSSSSSSSSQQPNAIGQLWDAYSNSTPARLKLIDAFLVFVMFSGIACFAYCVLITDFPFNSFLGAFSSCVGQFVLLASLRSQVNPENKVDFPSISPERAFADFTFASLLLHFFSFNFLG